VNDRLGHAAGDYVLKEFVLRATQCIRETSDWLARSGGDEFVIVMPETDLDGANCAAQKLRCVLATPPLIVHDRPLQMSVSIGVAASETHREMPDTTALDLLLEADRGLYASKQSGKAAMFARVGYR
jgi:diguanylate cyclase (GGDEF)-like protein